MIFCVQFLGIPCFIIQHKVYLLYNNLYSKHVRYHYFRVGNRLRTRTAGETSKYYQQIIIYFVADHKSAENGTFLFYSFICIHSISIAYRLISRIIKKIIIRMAAAIQRANTMRRPKDSINNP